MAKVQSPFLSVIASGSVGKSLTASRWRGIKVMKEYSVATNPQTVTQQTQRQYIANAISFWKYASMSTDVKEAWGRYVQKLARRMSGVNAFSGAIKNTYEAGLVPISPVSVYFYSVIPGYVAIRMYVKGVTAQALIPVVERDWYCLWGWSVREVGLYTVKMTTTYISGNLVYLRATIPAAANPTVGRRVFCQAVDNIGGKVLPLSGIHQYVITA